MENFFEMATEKTEFFFMPVSIETFMFMMLYLMLFWKKKVINFLICLHVLVIAGIFSGAWLISDMFLLVDNIEAHQFSTLIFSENITNIQNIALPFFCLWIYQSWRINKESAKMYSDY